MALRILFPGDRNSLSTLAPGSFTRQNYGAAGMTSARITADTPDGALAGMVAEYAGDYQVQIYTTSNKPVGVFINDAAGSPFENTPAVASGKLTFMRSMGSYETDIYETILEVGAGAVVYAVGGVLYASKWGMLSADPALNACPVVARISKVPSATDPWLGFDLLI
jgi:hypothetical protein